MPMNKWVKRKWLRALRSGEYRKGQSRLGVDAGSYCCLGVLACEMIPELAIRWDGIIIVGDDMHYLPDDLTLLYGLSKLDTIKLADINDNSKTFGPVIQYIEKRL